jgi:hypothetical protein
MKYQSTTFSLIILMIMGCSAPVPTNNPDKEEWIQLFNGIDMTGWTPKFKGQKSGVNFRNTFRVKDSLLSVNYEEWETFDGEFGHLFYQQEFSYYRIRATYRFVGDQVTGGPGWAYRNNGLMLHAQSVESMGLDQDFPISIEYQLRGGNGTDDQPNCNLCTPGTHVNMADTLFTPHCISSTSSTYHGDQWVTVEALVYGDSLIQHLADGQVVMEYTKPIVDGGNVDGLKEGVTLDGRSLSAGFITIQAETAPIDFASIEVLDLCGCMDKKAKNYKSYFVKTDNSKCEY